MGYSFLINQASAFPRTEGTSITPSTALKRPRLGALGPGSTGAVGGAGGSVIELG